MKREEVREREKIKGCWKSIGVWGNAKGDEKCPELARVIHCRNCEVFTRAGRNLLDRELPESYMREWTEIMSSEKEEELFNTVSVLIFRIESEWLAIRTVVFSEVLDPQRLHRHTLPHRRNPVLIGIINVRGEIQICVSFKEMLGIESTGQENGRFLSEYERCNRMLVMETEGNRWVFPVTEILGIHRVHPTSFQNVPVTVAKAQSTYTKGIFMWNGKQVGFLDDDLLNFSLLRSVQ